MRCATHSSRRGPLVGCVVRRARAGAPRGGAPTAPRCGPSRARAARRRGAATPRARQLLRTGRQSHRPRLPLLLAPLVGRCAPRTRASRALPLRERHPRRPLADYSGAAPPPLRPPARRRSAWTTVNKDERGALGDALRRRRRLRARRRRLLLNRHFDGLAAQTLGAAAPTAAAGNRATAQPPVRRPHRRGERAVGAAGPHTDASAVGGGRRGGGGAAGRLSRSRRRRRSLAVSRCRARRCRRRWRQAGARRAAVRRPQPNASRQLIRRRLVAAPRAQASRLCHRPRQRERRGLAADARAAPPPTAPTPRRPAPAPPRPGGARVGGAGSRARVHGEDSAARRRRHRRRAAAEHARAHHRGSALLPTVIFQDLVFGAGQVGRLLDSEVQARAARDGGAAVAQYAARCSAHRDEELGCSARCAAIAVLRQLTHPRISRLVASFDGRRRLPLARYASRGDLHALRRYVARCRTLASSSPRCASPFARYELGYLGDLKPENILLGVGPREAHRFWRGAADGGAPGGGDPRRTQRDHGATGWRLAREEAADDAAAEGVAMEVDEGDADGDGDGDEGEGEGEEDGRLGAPRCISPELVGGAAPSVASDCWALGARCTTRSAGGRRCGPTRRRK